MFWCNEIIMDNDNNKITQRSLLNSLERYFDIYSRESVTYIYYLIYNEII